MNIHEYQAKSLLKQYGVNILEGGVAFSVEEAHAQAEKIAKKTGEQVWVVKSQIHAGGRGAGHFADDPERHSGGGVRIVKSLDEVEKQAGQMLDNILITKQTGPKGTEVKRLLIEEGCQIERELYLAFLVDRSSGSVSIIASTEGGMDIEEVAEKTPEKIFSVTIDPVSGFQPHHARTVIFGLELGKAQFRDAARLLESLYRSFTDLDCAMIEINPLVTTRQGHLVALDAKVNFDESALFRHPEIEDMRDESEEEPLEREASTWDLNYVKLDGSIGCMVNGAGLAMATMDIIKLYGAEPANFLDVGGGTSKERVIAAFRIILSDPNVKGILVNIFGGIVRCDLIAEAIIAAAKEINLTVPLVVRLEGTNAEQGKQVLKNSDVSVIAAADLNDAAKKIVRCVKEGA